MEIVYIATKSKGKIKEFENFFTKYNVIVKSLLDIDETIEIEENGNTFAENALIKARFLAKYLNTNVIADDSGLIVDILNDEPGIYSARYSGVHGDDLANNLKLLNKLKNVPIEKRSASFICALALVKSNGEEVVFNGTCKGLIIDDMRGDNGFGYDPLFYIESLHKTFGELTKEEKEIISHRGKALRLLEEYLSQ